MEETSSLLAHGHPVEHVREEIGKLLDLFDPIEQYWGFPGKSGSSRCCACTPRPTTTGLPV
jgi:hypothetical protein